jgi:isopentenyl phosphate kinase
MRRLSEEIADFWQGAGRDLLIIGHGSGSFGHSLANQHGTHRGASSAEDWAGGAEVWGSARRLNQMLLDSLTEAGLPVVAFPPSASGVSVKGELRQLAVAPVEMALSGGWIPLVHGDVVTDRDQGLSISSTEMVFAYLATTIRPTRVLLCGREAGVFADFPENLKLLPKLTPELAQSIGIFGAAEADVTGGMASKVEFSLGLLSEYPELEIHIFSGEAPGNLRRALEGERLGTRIQVEA